MEPLPPRPIVAFIEEILAKADPGLDSAAEAGKIARLEPDGKYTVLIKHLALLSVSEEYARSIWSSIQKRLMDSGAQTFRPEDLARMAADMAVNTDPLTGIFNRAFYSEKLAHEIERSRRHGRPLSLLVMDIDHFKHFNDTWGHQTGDVVLREVAQAVNGQVRNIDLAARYGGEEFVALLPDTDARGALLLAERVVATVRELPLEHPVTLSIGAATFPADAADGPALFEAADRYLYQAKQDGRNCVRSRLRMNSRFQNLLQRWVKRPLSSIRRNPKVSGLVGVAALAFLGLGALYWGERVKTLATWKLAHHEGFDDPARWKEQWTVLTGKWELGRGEVAAVEGLALTAQCKLPFRGNLRVEYDAVFDRGGLPCDLSVMLFAEAGKAVSGYGFQFGGNMNVRSVLTKNAGKWRGALASTTRAVIKPGKVHHVVAEYVDGNLSLGVDGRTILTYADLFPLSGEGRHYLNLYAYTPGARFRNLHVYRQRMAERPPLFSVGDALFNRGLTGAAREYYLELLDRQSAPAIQAQALYKVGKTWLQETNLIKARGVFERLSREHPGERMADYGQRDLGLTLLETGEAREGGDLLLRLLDLAKTGPFDWELANLSANAASALGRQEPDLAWQMVERASRILEGHDGYQTYLLQLRLIDGAIWRGNTRAQAPLMKRLLRPDNPYPEVVFLPSRLAEWESMEKGPRAAAPALRASLATLPAIPAEKRPHGLRRPFQGALLLSCLAGQEKEFLELLDGLDRHPQGGWLQFYTRLYRSKMQIHLGRYPDLGALDAYPDEQGAMLLGDQMFRRMEVLNLALKAGAPARVHPLFEARRSNATLVTLASLCYRDGVAYMMEGSFEAGRARLRQAEAHYREWGDSSSAILMGYGEVLSQFWEGDSRSARAGLERTLRGKDLFLRYDASLELACQELFEGRPERAEVALAAMRDALIDRPALAALKGFLDLMLSPVTGLFPAAGEGRIFEARDIEFIYLCPEYHRAIWSLRCGRPREAVEDLRRLEQICMAGDHFFSARHARYLLARCASR